MSRDIVSVSPDASLAKARTLMKVGRVHHLIVEDDRRIVGVLSERDLGAPKLPAKDGVVADVMTKNVVSASRGMTIRQAANLLRGRSIGCLPVVDGAKIVGIVTTTDLLELMDVASSERHARLAPRQSSPPRRREPSRGRC